MHKGEQSPEARKTERTRSALKLVGATRFERATSSTPWKRATKLRHAPPTRRDYTPSPNVRCTVQKIATNAISKDAGITTI